MAPSRLWYQVSSSLLILLFIIPSYAAPVYHKKNYKHYKNTDKRMERRLFQNSSPIHFIRPFMAIPPALNTLSNFLPASSPPMDTSVSPIFRLPLRIVSNAKPYGVLSGLPHNQHFMEMLPHAVSKIIHLPLKFISNAKPVGVYFKNPGLNFI